MKPWTKKFFIKEGKYWLYLMNGHWKYAPMQVKQITKILKRFGIKKGKILELACGNGRICTNLAKKRFEVSGIVMSPEYINDAKKKVLKKRVKVHYICGDIRYLGKYIKSKFDVILSIATSIGCYSKKTDQKIFKAIASLLKRNGIFLILNTMSREWLSSHFCATEWDDTERYIILHKPDYDRFHSIIRDNWRFYRKEGNNLIFEIELPIRLKIYSQNELTEMAENAGLKLIKAFDSLLTLAPIRPDSNIHMVVIKE